MVRRRNRGCREDMGATNRNEIGNSVGGDYKEK